MGAPCDAVFPFVTYEMVKTRQDDVMIQKVEQQESKQPMASRGTMI